MELTVRVPDGCLELHLWWRMRVVPWEFEQRPEEASSIKPALVADL